MAPTPNKSKNTTRLTEPAADTAAPAVIQEATTTEIVRSLIEKLGRRVNDVAEVQITKGGRIRVLGRDRSLRGHTFDYPTDEEETK